MNIFKNELADMDFLFENNLIERYVPGPKIIPPESRPREKLISHGVESLSDSELLAVLLNTGIQGKNVRILAEELTKNLNESKEIPSVENLSKIFGLGAVKACTIVAMLEFGRRRWGIKGTRIKRPADAFLLLRHFAECPQEQFFSISLTCACEVLAIRTITVGLVDRTIIHPREVFADLIVDRAGAAIVAHNHPSGNLEPSANDDEITSRLKKAADLLGINLFDHIIFSNISFFSYTTAKKLHTGQNEKNDFYGTF
ncbi:MAG: DNA repair protein RadC [Spirochaetaceae bacterium]|jgi:DNA repair protein RadC|nr:DNA repair protein RadC [Spirochaetaceae bacterium]